MKREDKSKLSIDKYSFLQIQKNFLHGDQYAYDESIDWSIIKRYGALHQMEPIVYQQTKITLFQESFAAQLFRTVNLSNLINEVDIALNDCRHIMVKGAVLSRLYPVPGLRTMGDVDVLIHLKDRSKAHEALVNAGFLLSSDGVLGEWKYYKRGFLLEVHDTLVHRYDGKEKLIEYFSHVWDYVNDNELDWSFHLLYLIEHLHQHFVGTGVGFRQFMDIAVVCLKVDIEWYWLEMNLKEIGLFDFARTVFAFIREWYDVATPLSDKQLDVEFFIESTNRIFENGVFGKDNAENDAADLCFIMHYHKLDYKTAKRQYLLKYVFPNYNVMCGLPYCTYVCRSKMLLPIAWVHRIIYRVFNKQSRQYHMNKISRNQVNTRMEMLHNWGL